MLVGLPFSTFFKNIQGMLHQEDHGYPRQNCLTRSRNMHTGFLVCCNKNALKAHQEIFKQSIKYRVSSIRVSSKPTVYMQGRLLATEANEIVVDTIVYLNN